MSSIFKNIFQQNENDFFLKQKRAQSGNIKNHLNNIPNNNNIFQEAKEENTKSICCEKKLISNKIFKDCYSSVKNHCNENCPNILIIKKLQVELKEITEVNLNLKKINDCLLSTIYLKEEKLIEANTFNKDLRLDNNILTKHINSRKGFYNKNDIQVQDGRMSNLNSIPTVTNLKQNFRMSVSNNKNLNDKMKFTSIDNKRNSNDCTYNKQSKKINPLIKFEKEEKFLNETNNNNNELNKFISNTNITNNTNSNSPIKPIKKNIENSLSNKKTFIENQNQNQTPLKLTENFDLNKNEGKNYNNNNNEMNIIKNSSEQINKSFKNSNTFYERISSLIRKTEKPINYKSKARASLLSLSDEQLDKILISEVMKNLKKICNHEDDFINFFKTTSEDIQVIYCDAIFQIIKDLESAVNLVKRIRNYISITSGITKNSFADNVTTAILTDAKDILICERVSIFVYEAFSDMLVIHSGEGLHRNEIRIPKNVGIVGEVFTKGEIIRVDDCYADKRFDSTFDKKSNFRTNTILAAPLRDKDGYIYGAIQCINKIAGKFTDDDEEMILLFSMHIGKIMGSAKNNDENVSFISKLKNVISFKSKIKNISNLKEFSLFVEDNIMNILSVQHCNLFFYNEIKNNLIKIGKYDYTQKSLNIGIIGNVFIKNEFLGIGSSGSCEFYNNIIDIETGMSILTYPISIKENVKGILQFSYNYKLINNKKPKETDENIIYYLLEDIEKWVHENEESFKEFMLNLQKF